MKNELPSSEQDCNCRGVDRDDGLHEASCVSRSSKTVTNIPPTDIRYWRALCEYYKDRNGNLRAALSQCRLASGLAKAQIIDEALSFDGLPVETSPKQLSRAHAKRILQDWIEDNEHVALVKASWPDLHEAYVALKALADSPEEPPAECDHPRSELLASKGDQFEMRKCLECTKIFRVRLREKAAESPDPFYCSACGQEDRDCYCDPSTPPLNGPGEPDGFCPVCYGRDGEHQKGCVDGDAPL